MQAFVIEGGQPLNGSVKAAGNKNGALPILAACVLTDEPVSLSNVPRIRDVETMIEILVALGVHGDWAGLSERRVRAPRGGKGGLGGELCGRIRAPCLPDGRLPSALGR